MANPIGPIHLKMKSSISQPHQHAKTNNSQQEISDYQVFPHINHRLKEEEEEASSGLGRSHDLYGR